MNFRGGVDCRATSRQRRSVSIFSALKPPPDAPPIADQAEVDATFKARRRTTLIALIIGYGMAYTCRLGLGVVKEPLIELGIFDPSQLGAIGASFLWGYGAGKFFNGFIADRVNPRIFIPIGLAVSGLLNLAMGSQTAIGLAIVIWALNGWFQGFLAPACVVSMTQWFSWKERGTVYGVWSASHSIGEGLTFIGTATIVGMTMWRFAFWAPGLACIAVAVFLFFVLRDRPKSLGLPTVEDWKGHGPAPVAKTIEDATERGPGLTVLLTPAIWVIGVASALMYVTRYAVNSWGVLYLQKTQDMSVEEAGFIIGINTIAGLGGSAAYGRFSDKIFGARRPPATLIFGALEVVGLLMIFYGNNKWILIAGMIVYGFTLGGLIAVLGGLFAVDLAPKGAAGAAMGVVGVFSYIGAGSQEFVSGALIESGMTKIDGVVHYDFTQAVLFWVGSSVVSMLLAASLWSIRPVDQDATSKQ